MLDRGGADGLLEGLSDNYLKVWFAGEPGLRGRIVRVRVEQVTGRGLLGSLQATGGATHLLTCVPEDLTFVPLEGKVEYRAT